MIPITPSILFKIYIKIMYQSPNNFDFDPNDKLVNSSSSEELAELIDDSDLDNIAKRNIIQRKKHLEKLFVYLIGFGVGLGLLLALILTMVLHKFGLLEKPNDIKSKPQQTEILKLEGIEKQ